MPRINLIPDPIQDPEPETEDRAAGWEIQDPCPWCLGKGRYVGFFKVEDPCRYCAGAGRIGIAPGRERSPRR